MPPRKYKLYLHTCTSCGKERSSTVKSNPSGMCQPCITAFNNAHGVRQQRHFLPGSFYDEKTLARFWKKVNFEASCSCHTWEERCWIWTAHLNVDGYGIFTYATLRAIPAHRFAFQAVYGELPSHIFALHQPPCALRMCVRHIYAGTPKQNMEDKKVMGHLLAGDRHWTRLHPETVLRGEQIGNAVMTESIVRAIRREHASGISFSALATKYACCKSTIGLIVRRQSWKHI